MNRITRVEVIDENGRSYVNWEDDNDWESLGDLIERCYDVVKTNETN